jgi:hypothetical protein
MAHRTLETDVCIIGAGCGGFAAALAVARAGRKCVVTEPTDWIGGQLTAQAVPPDENRWIEYEMGVQSATGSYLHLRDGVRQWYRDRRPLADAARNNPRLNPGNGWVSHLCTEPTILHTLLQETIAPHIASGAVTILLETELTRADVSRDAIRSVDVVSKDGTTTTIRAKYFLDASEFGDLLPLAGAEFRIGAEGVNDHGELHANPKGNDPNDQQAVSYCFAIEHRPGENHTISRPANYDFWRDYVPPLDTGWPGKLLSWTVVGGERHEPREFAFKPWPQEPDANELEMWRYRRIVDRSIYKPDAKDAPPDVALINMVQMDYFLRPLLQAATSERVKIIEEARQLSLCFLYWMQTEAPRYDGKGVGFPGLKLRGDELGTANGFAKHVYVREARRLEAVTVVHEGMVGTDQRRREGRPDQNASPYGMAECFHDSVGVGHYRLDLHPSTAMRNSVYAQSAPFRIPLGALIPKRMANLLAAGKCLGVTHVVNGGYRLHPIEWNIGEAAGAVAAYAIEKNTTPRGVRESIPLLREFQARLVKQEFALAWPWERGAGLS